MTPMQLRSLVALQSVPGRALFCLAGPDFAGEQVWKCSKLQVHFSFFKVLHLTHLLLRMVMRMYIWQVRERPIWCSGAIFFLALGQLICG
jgi:hypothetical protein